jgi:Protein of unknown function (DUF4019)
VKFTSALIAALALLSVATRAAAQDDTTVAQAASVRDVYWSALDSGRYTDAYALFTPGLQALAGADEHARESQHAATTYGRPLERRVMRTTRYDSPAHAPAPGIYIAFDYVARFERADHHCGYVILYQGPDGGPFQVTRTDDTYMTNDVATDSSRSGQSIDQVWMQMATAHCPGWQPSWAIQPPV